MKWKIYHDYDLFKQKVEPFLLEKEEKNNLPLGILYRLKTLENVFAATIENGGGLVAVFLQTPPHSMTAVMDENQDLEKLIHYSVSHLQQEHPTLPGIISSKTFSHRFAEEWAERQNRTYKIHMEQCIMACNQVNSILLSDGKLELARKDQKQVLTGWLLEFVEESNLLPVVRDNAEIAILQAIENETLYTWSIEGNPVSMVNKTRSTKNSIGINQVYTPKQYRNRGFASSSVHQLTEQLLKQLTSCILYTDLSNPTSNSIYKKIGYKPVAESSHILFD